MECDYTKLESNFVEYILNIVGPNIELDKSREIKFHSLKNIILKAFYFDQSVIPHFFCYGSYPLHTYLPDSDIDVTIILEDKNTHTIITNYPYDHIHKILFLIKSVLENYNQDRGYSHITEINLIMAEIKLIKFKYDNLSFDVSINNFVGLCKIIFMSYIEKNLMNSEINRRSLFLIKAWCYYEGCILGSNLGLLANYAVETLVIYMFNNYDIEDELDALFKFINMMKEIDWQTKILTIFGLLESNIYYEELKECEYDLNKIIIKMFSKKGKLNIDNYLSYITIFEKFNQFDRNHSIKINKKAITLKYINIIDPIFNNNNLGKSVNFHNFTKLKKVFEYVNRDCQKIKESKKNSIIALEYLNNLLKLFRKTIIANNSELFYNMLPHAKIIICSIKNDEEKLITFVNEKLISLFNNKFNIINSIENPQILSNFLWSSSNNEAEEKEKISAFNQKNKSFITKEIIEFIMNDKSNEYIFKLSDDIIIIEEFIKNCVFYK